MLQAGELTPGRGLPAPVPLWVATCHLLKAALLSDTLLCFQTLHITLFRVLSREVWCVPAMTGRGGEKRGREIHAFPFQALRLEALL